jgi:hypothetical protein
MNIDPSVRIDGPAQVLPTKMQNLRMGPTSLMLRETLSAWEIHHPTRHHHANEYNASEGSCDPGNGR